MVRDYFSRECIHQTTLNRVRRQSGFPTCILAQRHYVRTSPTPSRCGDNRTKVKTFVTSAQARRQLSDRGGSTSTHSLIIQQKTEMCGKLSMVSQSEKGGSTELPDPPPPQRRACRQHGITGSTLARNLARICLADLLADGEPYCNITPNISSILQWLFHGGRTEAARQYARSIAA